MTRETVAPVCRSRPSARFEATEANIAQLESDVTRDLYRRARREYDRVVAEGPRGSAEYARNFNRYLAGKRETRDLSEAVGSAGGYMVSASFDRRVLLGLSYNSALIGRCDVWRSPNGAPATRPTVFAEATGAVAEAAIAEDTAVTETDPAIGRVVWPQAPYWSSRDDVRLSIALARDAAAVGIDLSVMLGDLFSARLARGIDAAFWATIKASTPTTVLTSAAAAAPSYADLVALYFGIDPAMRTANAAWFMADSTVKLLKGIVDASTLRPVLLDQPTATIQDDTSILGDSGAGTRALRVPTIFGHPVFSVRSLPAWTATTASAIYFGDMQRAFTFRYVSCDLQVLVERYADYGELGYISRLRADGQTTDPSGLIRMTVHA